MALFADMPVPPLPLLVPSNGQVTAPDLTSGEISGLNASLIDLFQNYRPGNLGVDQLLPQIGLTLPVPEWSWASRYKQDDTVTINAGTAQDLFFLTVPENERWMLDGLNLVIESGDNKISRLYIDYPTGYADSLGNFLIPLRLATAAQYIWWPDDAGVQTVSNYYMPGGSILLEPGTRLGTRTDGSGVSATTWTYLVRYRSTKFLRALAP